MFFKQYILLFITLTPLFSCGSRSTILPIDARKEVRLYAHEPNQTHSKIPYVKGSWSTKISHRSDSLNLSPAQFSFETSSTVGIHLAFEIGDTEFIPPENPIDGILSFGKFSLSKLRDNNLKVCGESGNKKCQFAAIRIYTTGTPGEGYWNTDENYGLPIKTGDFALPHLAENALYLEEIDLSSIRVLKLSHFSDAVKSIPINIDFSDAAFGDYSTEIVIDYVLY